MPAVMSSENDCGSGQVRTMASAAMAVPSSSPTDQAVASPGRMANTSVEQRTSSPAARCLASAFIPPVTT